jgi:hypothetical protein
MYCCHSIPKKDYSPFCFRLLFTATVTDFSVLLPRVLRRPQIRHPAVIPRTFADLIDNDPAHVLSERRATTKKISARNVWTKAIATDQS